MLPIGDENLGRRRPIVNYALIGTCIAVFALQGLAPGDSEAFVRTWGLVPARLLDDGPFAAYTLITHMFLHGNLLHIGGNMLFLWVFGDNIEDEFGHIPYLLFYLGTGVLAGLASVALRSTSDVPGIGASGAISGVLGAYLVLFPLNEVRVVILHPFTVLLWLGSIFLQNRPELPKIGISALYVLLFYVIYNFMGALMGIISPSRVDSVAHLGGFLGRVSHRAHLAESFWPVAGYDDGDRGANCVLTHRDGRPPSRGGTVTGSGQLGRSTRDTGSCTEAG